MIIWDTPTSCRFVEPDQKKMALVQAALTYTNKSVDYQIRQLKKARWFDAERHQERLDDLQEARRVCLLSEMDGSYVTYSGLATDVDQILHQGIERRIVYPNPKTIPWAEVPPELRPYQQETVDLFLDKKHAAAEMATGLGKSYIILHLAKILGLKTIVMAPTTSIADQLYDDFTRFLGKKYVGRYYGGKKDSAKLFTVAIHASLARISLDSPDYLAFSSAQVFIADESHLTPAATLKEVCLGLCASAPYRFFLSGTQLRADGSDLLLRGITGPILKKMTVADGVAQGYLAAPRFRIFPITSDDSYATSDALRMTQRHFYYNQAIIRKAVALANFAVTRMNHQVLIAIEEIEQFRDIIPHLTAQYKFACGNITKDNLKYVPEEHRNGDNSQIVADFNAGKFPVLIGTSAISMGTDIRPVKTIINLTGGKSEVQIRQLVGRGTRKVEGKTECMVFDFDVVNVPMLHRHAEERVGVYADIYPDVEMM
jgi:superfamily II DNA or RNA helicase